MTSRVATVTYGYGYQLGGESERIAAGVPAAGAPELRGRTLAEPFDCG